MSTPQAGPVLTPFQLAEQDNYIFTLLAEGSYANVYLSLPRATANKLFADVDEGRIALIIAYQILRNALQAIKITKGNTSDTADKLDRECLVLDRIAKKGSRSIVKILAPKDVKTCKQFYSLELLTGNTFGAYLGVLSSVERKGNDTYWGGIPYNFVPVSFGWHLILQLTEALLMLHFGEKDGQEDERWPMYTHNDIHQNNLLFRGGKGAFKDYPDIVIIDFGKVKTLRTQATDQKRTDFFEAQHFDMKRAISNVVDYAFPEDVALNGVYNDLRDLDIQKGANKNQALKEWMGRLRTRCLEEREKQYEPLAPALVRHFRLELVNGSSLWTMTSAKRRREQQDNGQAGPGSS